MKAEKWLTLLNFKDKEILNKVVCFLMLGEILGLDQEGVKALVEKRFSQEEE